MKKKKEPTSDAVEILRRHYGNNLWRKFCRWWYRQLIRKEIGIYNTGYDDGYTAGWNAAKKSEMYPL